MLVNNSSRPQTLELPRTPVAARPPLGTTVTPSRAALWLSALIGVLALIAAGAGMFWQSGDGAFTFVTLDGEAMEMFGRGIYHDDTLFKGALNRGTDAVTLALGLPLLAVSSLLYRRGSLRGALLLTGTLGYFLYVYASVALGAAYNGLFVLSIALFSASLFAFVLTFTSIDRERLTAHLSPILPRRVPGLFMLASGLVTLVVWLTPLLAAQLKGDPPPLLDTYTTSVTDVLDLGIITPAAFLAGALILRRSPLGYLMAFSLLVLEMLLAPLITAQTLFQLNAGVSFTASEIIGPITGFTGLGLASTWITARLLRHIPDTP